MERILLYGVIDGVSNLVKFRGRKNVEVNLRAQVHQLWEGGEMIFIWP